MKKIFKIDGGLYPLGLFAILSGMGLHMAGHGGNHHTWEIWAVVHSVTAVSLTLLIACHIQTHWLGSTICINVQSTISDF